MWRTKNKRHFGKYRAQRALGFDNIYCGVYQPLYINAGIINLMDKYNTRE